MAFVESTYAEGTPRVDPQTGAVVGGRNTSKPQRSAERFIPDLQSIFQGGLGVFVSFHKLPLDPHNVDEIRDGLMADQVRTPHGSPHLLPT